MIGRSSAPGPKKWPGGCNWNSANRYAALLLLALLAGCGPGPALPPPAGPAPGALLLEDLFTAPGDWDTFALQGARAQVENGGYRLTTTLMQFVFGRHAATYQDVILEAEAYWLPDHEDGLYGLLCRSGRNGKGYYFLISADGHFSIRRSGGQSVEALVAWQASAAILRGSRRNLFRVVCAGERLALFINGQFVAETTDALYRAGAVGVVTALPRPAPAGALADVVFDNVRVWALR